MSKGVKLSPNYGLNPTIPVCFWCGEEKNEIALLGKIGGRGEDLEAPRRVVLDYEPCDSCKAKFSQGVLVVEVDERNILNIPPLVPDVDNSYPTGRYVVVKPGVLNVAGPMCMMMSDEFEAVFGEYV